MDIGQLISDLCDFEYGRSTNYGELIERSLFALEMDQKSLAVEIGVSPPTIHRWIHGKSAPYKIVSCAVIELLQSKVEGLQPKPQLDPPAPNSALRAVA